MASETLRDSSEPGIHCLEAWRGPVQFGKGLWWMQGSGFPSWGTIRAWGLTSLRCIKLREFRRCRGGSRALYAQKEPERCDDPFLCLRSNCRYSPKFPKHRREEPLPFDLGRNEWGCPRTAQSEGFERSASLLKTGAGEFLHEARVFSDHCSALKYVWSSS